MARKPVIRDTDYLVIPARVSSLGAYAFRYTQFTSVEFETGSRVTAIPASFLTGRPASAPPGPRRSWASPAPSTRTRR